MATIQVEVVYARSDCQAIVQLELDAGATVRNAIVASGMLEKFPEIQIVHGTVGIWGVAVPLDAKLASADRIEIYRPLVADPKVVRRRRAQEQAPKTRTSSNCK